MSRPTVDLGLASLSHPDPKAFVSVLPSRIPRKPRSRAAKELLNELGVNAEDASAMDDFKRQRNKAAAQASRDRRRYYTTDLEERVIELAAVGASLAERVCALAAAAVVLDAHASATRAAATAAISAAAALAAALAALPAHPTGVLDGVGIDPNRPPCGPSEVLPPAAVALLAKVNDDGPELASAGTVGAPSVSSSGRGARAAATPVPPAVVAVVSSPSVGGSSSHGDSPGGPQAAACPPAHVPPQSLASALTAVSAALPPLRPPTPPALSAAADAGPAAALVAAAATAARLQRYGGDVSAHVAAVAAAAARGSAVGAAPYSSPLAPWAVASGAAAPTAGELLVACDAAAAAAAFGPSGGAFATTGADGSATLGGFYSPTVGPSPQTLSAALLPATHAQSPHYPVVHGGDVSGDDAAVVTPMPYHGASSAASTTSPTVHSSGTATPIMTAQPAHPYAHAPAPAVAPPVDVPPAAMPRTRNPPRGARGAIWAAQQLAEQQLLHVHQMQQIQLTHAQHIQQLQQQAQHQQMAMGYSAAPADHPAALLQQQQGFVGAAQHVVPAAYHRNALRADSLDGLHYRTRSSSAHGSVHSSVPGSVYGSMHGSARGVSHARSARSARSVQSTGSSVSHLPAASFVSPVTALSMDGALMGCGPLDDATVGGSVLDTLADTLDGYDEPAGLFAVAQGAFYDGPSATLLDSDSESDGEADRVAGDGVDRHTNPFGAAGGAAGGVAEHGVGPTVPGHPHAPFGCVAGDSGPIGPTPPKVRRTLLPTSTHTFYGADAGGTGMLYAGAPALRGRRTPAGHAAGRSLSVFIVLFAVTLCGGHVLSSGTAAASATDVFAVGADGGGVTPPPFARALMGVPVASAGVAGGLPGSRRPDPLLRPIRGAAGLAPAAPAGGPSSGSGGGLVGPIASRVLLDLAAWTTASGTVAAPAGAVSVVGVPMVGGTAANGGALSLWQLLLCLGVAAAATGAVVSLAFVVTKLFAARHSLLGRFIKQVDGAHVQSRRRHDVPTPNHQMYQRHPFGYTQSAPPAAWCAGATLV